MKHVFLFAGLLLILLSACDEKEKDDLANTASNSVDDINSLAVFETRIASGVSMVFFHASWCTVCAEQRPAFEATSANQAFANVFFGEVEFEANNDINQPYGIAGFPSIVFYKDGVEQSRLTGKGHSQATLEATINALI